MGEQIMEDLFELVGDGSPEEVQKAVDEGANVNARNKVRGTPLIYAAEYNENPEVIKILLDAGADINNRVKGGWTHLMYGIIYNENPEVIKVLLDAGSDVNARDKDAVQPPNNGEKVCLTPSFLRFHF